MTRNDSGELLEAPLPAKKPPRRTTYSLRVAARVRELREERGWLVNELAARINRGRAKDDRLAVSTIHSWDNGSRKIDPDFYPTLARAFGLPLFEFLPGS